MKIKLLIYFQQKIIVRKSQIKVLLIITAIESYYNENLAAFRPYLITFTLVLLNGLHSLESYKGNFVFKLSTPVFSCKTVLV